MSETLTIRDIGHRGDGVAQTPSGDVFVAFALPGEAVHVQADAAQADRRTLVSVETPSAERIDPICPHFGLCGGCATQHWAREPTLAWKRRLVESALRDAGLSAPVAPTIDAHGDGRRRVTLHARREGAGVIVGFAIAREHRIIPLTQCPVLAPSLANALSVARKLAETLGSPKPLDIQITATDDGLDVDVRGSGPIPAARTAALAELAARSRLARLTRHGELVLQTRPPTLRMGRATVTLPPGSFLQATMAGEATLAGAVLGHSRESRSVADLFCGVGPFALRLAERSRVFAADSSAPAVNALKQALTAASGLKPVETQVRDLFRRPLVPAELKRFDTVVFDPPRQGAEAQARELAKSAVPRIIAVSCNAATFARDARILCEGGYRLAGVTPVDQFRYSPHVELVARFDR